MPCIAYVCRGHTFDNQPQSQSPPLTAAAAAANRRQSPGTPRACRGLRYAIAKNRTNYTTSSRTTVIYHNHLQCHRQDRINEMLIWWSLSQFIFAGMGFSSVHLFFWLSHLSSCSCSSNDVQFSTNFNARKISYAYALIMFTIRWDVHIIRCDFGQNKQQQQTNIILHC